MFRPALAAAVDGDRPVAPLPAVAVGAMVDAPAVEGPDPLDLGDLVDDPRGEQELAPRQAGAVVQRDLEPALDGAPGP
jgi:hypothetical protein